jgi:cation transport ATPase
MVSTMTGVADRVFGEAVYTYKKRWRLWQASWFQWLLKVQRPKLSFLMPKTPHPEAQLIYSNLTLSSLSLGLAVAGALFHPVLGLACTPVLLYLSLPLLRRTWHTAVHEQRVDGDLLDTMVVVVSFGTGQWTVTALQFWLSHLGEKRLRQAEDAARQQLMLTLSLPAPATGERQTAPQCARTHPLLTVGDQIVVEPGEVIPADGVIISGCALIDENMLTGATRPAEKEAKDCVFATTVLLAGRISFLVERSNAETVAAQMHAALQRAATDKTRFQVQRTAQTHQTAVWMLSVGGLASLLTGVNTAAALSDARLGYDSEIVTPLALLHYLKLALRNGLLVKDGRSFERMAQVDTVVFDGRVIQHHAARATIRALRQRGLAHIYLLTTHPSPAAETLGIELGLDAVFTTAIPQARGMVIQRLQAEGKTICLVGDGVTDAAAMRQADVAISLRSVATLADDAAQVILLDERLDRITHLYDLAKRWQMQLHTISQALFLPGLLTIASTLFLNTGLMMAVLLDACGLFAGIYAVKFLTAPKRVTANLTKVDN